ncbi:MAG: type IV secretion system protein VirD [Mesorhizobium sp.]|uniref:DNA mobilization endonuclease VirD1/MobC family subunit n=1 Tax=Mesorhizobium sp. TaxID=1871066 RepID=UPI000FE742D6|nr:DNA mobilization endonuclease VirD1/MobC family subunit [Mesorhizobium sp.]RWI50537.1 MAG: type IV secretion system protein VirD [Mesorhizobium sp.]
MNRDENLFPLDAATISIGRRKHAVSADGYKIVSLRLREAEFEAFSEQASSFGLTNNMALRIAARRIAGFLEIDDDTRQLLLDIGSAIDVVSERILDLKVNCARSGQVDMKEFAAQHAAFGQLFAQLDGELRTILNISRRRTDGRLMLQRAMNS